MKKNLKRNIVMAAVLLFVCAAVYLNWSYNNRQGTADSAMVKAEDEAMAAANEQYLETLAEEERASETTPAYFASARLTRQQSRDEALNLLETAAAGEGASQETIDSAMRSITAMATWSLQETQIENLLLAKDFADGGGTQPLRRRGHRDGDAVAAHVDHAVVKVLCQQQVLDLGLL